MVVANLYSSQPWKCFREHISNKTAAVVCVSLFGFGLSYRCYKNWGEKTKETKILNVSSQTGLSRLRKMRRAVSLDSFPLNKDVVNQIAKSEETVQGLVYKVDEQQEELNKLYQVLDLYQQVFDVKTFKVNDDDLNLEFMQLEEENQKLRELLKKCIECVNVKEREIKKLKKLEKQRLTYINICSVCGEFF